MVVIVVVLDVVVALKLVAIVNAIRWLDRHGPAYRRTLSRVSVMTPARRDQILDQHRAGFFPFGLKDYQLERYLRQMRPAGAAAWAGLWLLTVFRKVLFQFQGPAFLSFTLLILTAKAPAPVTVMVGRGYGWFGAVLGILLMAVVIALAVEAFISYVVLGSYGVAFHRLDIPRERRTAAARGARPRRSPRTGSVITEMSAYAGIMLTGLAVLGSTTYFLSMRLGGFALVPSARGGSLLQTGSLFDAFYWTTMIVGGSGGAGPSSLLARFVTVLGVVTVVIMFVFVVAVLAAITMSARSLPASRSRTRPGATTRPARPPAHVNDPGARRPAIANSHDGCRQLPTRTAASERVIYG